MTLRDHPLMSYRGISNWPPVWTKTRDDNVKTVKGEVGVLTYVYCNARWSTKCFLVIDYKGETYVGTLFFQNHSICKQVTDLMSKNIHRPISEIGELDLSHLL